MEDKDSFIIDDRMDANKGMVISVIYKDGREEKIPCGRVLKSRKKVKTIPKGGCLWCDIKNEKEYSLCGIILQGVKSFSFEIIEGEGWRWTLVVPPGSCWLNHPKGSQQAEFMWIDTSIDSTTYRIILRGERVDKDVIIYSFVIP